jgi:hypothetical protein
MNIDNDSGAQLGHRSLKASGKQGTMREQRFTNPQRPRLLSLKEAASFLGIGIWTMRDLVWSGSVPLVRFKRRMYFDARDLEQLIERNKTTYN